ncbi:BamA/TamA family outer membrane protein [Sulfurimonas aquatica]|uniref:BamA/TamA family outer membrane protein n=1 Tax=Sulfurimonas aquatica TaxID=2672570 RepID=A0A975B2F7_9BACT|nr:BamA/TamA family outer membrane protein [Sulfurimonas aquatica]QSZ42910.1 BamA/TamA family outer membrane protein [Sulfurimonas aquatica]
MKKKNIHLVVQFILLFLLSSHLFAQKIPLLFEGQSELQERGLYEALNLKKLYLYEFYKEEPKVDIKSIKLLLQVIQNYYRTKGFYHTEVSYYEREGSVIISIKENEPMLVESIEIDSKLDIVPVLPFKKSELFNADAFSKSKKDIKLLYSKESYCDISLDSKAYVDTQKNSVRLVYKVVENELCHFKKIEVNSSKNISADIAKSLLYFEEGDLFSIENIKKSYKNIYAYDGVSKVLIETQVENNSSVNIKLEIEENEKPLRFIAGLGISSDEGLMGQMGLKHRNFYGNLKSLGVETRVTEVKQSIKMQFDMPLLYKDATGFEVGLENEIFSGFTEYRLFSSAYLTQRYIPSTFKESLILDRTSTYNAQDTVLFPEAVLLVVSPKLEWMYDTRDSLLDPKNGYFFSSDIMGSIKSTLSDASYLKGNIKGAYLYPIKSSTLGAKVTFGALNVFDGVIPASYRYFAGGMHSNRAYTYRDLGPKNSNGNPSGFDTIVESTLEYRFPLYGDFRAVLFSDNSFVGDSYLPDSQTAYYSGGVGLRYISPIGPIAFDVGFDLSNPSSQFAFHFHIGELF